VVFARTGVVGLTGLVVFARVVLMVSIIPSLFPKKLKMSIIIVINIINIYF